MSSEGIQLPHTCPHCNKKATTAKELNDLFGIRTLGEKAQSQSWCKKCRNKGNKV